MNKHTALIACIFFLTSCSTNTSSTQKPSTPSGIVLTKISPILDSTSLEKDAPKVDDTIGMINDRLKAEPAYRACMVQSVQACNSTVISRFSQEKDSDESCNIFDDATLRTTCINAVDTELARRKSDPSYCAKLDPNAKKNCEQQVIIAQAIKTKDIRICETLKTPEDIQKIDIPTNAAIISPSVVMNINTNSQCIMQVLLTMDPTEKNLELCSAISDKNTEKNCIFMMKSRIDIQKNIMTSPVSSPNALPPTASKQDETVTSPNRRRNLPMTPSAPSVKPSIK